MLCSIKIPWKIWDNLVLRGNLQPSDFKITQTYDPCCIDLITIAQSCV